ncbi:hypothetical protein PH213_20605 [Streptomyces sp. SRF1]|uniref:hypothetical protein n=1 Tax=Streptomyces sp. SRF1 TaxID=1549642 RepID=UPI0025AEE673|nr:hypothetical protein [Streptomyces sp. SRF1]MDN3056908.1 hypothetical protein [Streptomyces sp. SRF1]
MIGPEQLAPLVQEVLALDCPPAYAAYVIDHIGDHGDHGDMFGVCYAAAEAGRAALLTLFPEGAADNCTWSLADVAHRLTDPYQLFAARFLTAHCNGDAPTTVALFRAAEDAGARDRTESVCVLLAYVRSLCRRAEAGPAAPHYGDTRS